MSGGGGGGWGGESLAAPFDPSPHGNGVASEYGNAILQDVLLVVVGCLRGVAQRGEGLIEGHGWCSCIGHGMDGEGEGDHALKRLA